MSRRAPRPFIIPVFLPHSGCPHRCVFCNQYAITGKRTPLPSLPEMAAGIEEHLCFKGPQRTCSQIAFYGGNFLGLSPGKIQGLLDSITPFLRSGKVDGIRFSTRPDTVTPDSLDRLKGYPVDAIELGVQSMDDAVLKRIRRGHDAGATAAAVRLLKERRIRVGLQLMVGLPAEDRASCRHTGHQVAGLAPDFVRIYPTVVIRESLLEEWFRNGEYLPLTMEESVFRAKSLYLLFESNRIPVIRMGLQPTADLDGSLVAGPYHPAFGELVHSEVFFDKAKEALDAARPDGKACVLRVHPRSESKMRGPSNRNLHKLKSRFALDSVRLLPDPCLPEDAVSVSCFHLC